MATRVLTPENEQFIKESYLIMSTKEMAATLDCAKGTVQSAMRRFGLSMPKELIMERRSKAMKGRSTATPEEDRIIIANYLTMPEKTLAQAVGRSHTFVNTRIRQLGLVIPPEVIAQRKLDSQIKPGSVPANKGLKQTDYMSAEAIEKTKGTRFKKGQKIHNELKDGDITIRHEHPDRNGGRPYKYIRISKGNWRHLHVHNWEAANGPVPEGFILVAKDGDSLNCEPDNWELITHAENMKRNSGAVRLPDSMVAFYLDGSKNSTPEGRKMLLQFPELIKTKRLQLLTKRFIRERSNNSEAGGNEG